MINKYILPLLFFLLFNSLSAQKRNSQSLIFWGGAGYFNILNNADDIKSSGRMGVDIGGGYEWKFNDFIIHTGAEFMYGRPVFNMNNFVHEKAMIDTEGDPYTGKFYFNENRDRYSLGYINIPLMAGMQFKKVYFLAGGKVGLNIIGKSNVHSRIKSAGLYPQYIEEFEDMPNHFFFTQDVDGAYPIKFNLNYSVSAEVGIKLAAKQNERKSRWNYRLGLFCDYGLANLKNKEYAEEPLLERAEVPYYSPIMNSLMRSTELKDKHINSLFIGLRFTAFFGLKAKRSCRCEWY